MMPLNTDIPRFTAYIRSSLLNGRAWDTAHEEFTIFGVRSHAGFALQWWGLSSRGAIRSGIPTHWLATTPRPAAPPLPLLEVWDAPSADIHAHTFAQLAGHLAEVRIGTSRASGRYAFTLDWTGSHLATEPDAKCAHAILLDSGHIGVFPNNLLYFHDPELVPDPYAGTDERPDWIPHPVSHRTEARAHHAAHGSLLHYHLAAPASAGDGHRCNP
jgi:hypothetical protein